MSRAPKLSLILSFVAVIAVGCLGANPGPTRYARYLQRERDLRRIDRLVASIPAYPRAHLTMRRDAATSYKISASSYLEAAPYSSDLYYDIDAPASGNRVQRHFRRALTGTGWICQFNIRAPGDPYGFHCRRGTSNISAFIADHSHYELVVFADTTRAPIPVVPGD